MAETRERVTALVDTLVDSAMGHPEVSKEEADRAFDLLVKMVEEGEKRHECECGQASWCPCLDHPAHDCPGTPLTDAMTHEE